MAETAIKIENLSKRYRLGVIGAGTLNADLQSWWAKVRGREDPNLKIGQLNAGLKDNFWALDDINLTIARGETVGIIGGNGAGKSTLLKILSRVTAPTRGVVYINGQISSMLEVGTGFHGELTGRENIYMNGAILGMSRKEVDSKIESIIDFSECRQFIDTPVKRYSSGMYVKLAFSVAAYLDSEILIMDEVLAVGDVKFQNKCLQKMKDLARLDNKTILYVSHNMSTIQQLCSRGIVLKEGRIIYDGKVDEAIKRYFDTEMQENTEVDLSRAPRFDNNTQKVSMLKLRFLNVDSPIVKMNDCVTIELTYRINEAIESLFMKFILRYTDSTSAGLGILNNLPGGIEGDVRTVSFKFHPYMLAPGEYDYRLALISLLENGQEIGHDTLQFCGKLGVVQDVGDIYNLNWVHNTYGHTFLGELRREA